MTFKAKLNRIALLLGLIFQVQTHTYAEIIDEVRVEGTPLEWNETIKALGSFLPGDENNQTKMNRALVRIKDYLENKGYPAAVLETSVTYRSAEVQKKSVLNFNIKLGNPIRINEVSFKFLNGALSTEQMIRLNIAVDLKPHEPYDRDRIKEMRRAIESTLATLSYVDSRVSKVDAESLNLPVPVPNALSSVRLVYEVELGQRVSFAVQGNEFFTRSELIALFEEQRLVGLGRDYVQVLFNRLRDRYVDYGFRDVQITHYSFEPKTEEPKKILFVINEGTRSKIKQIIFDGNDAFSNKELENLYFKNASDRIQSRIYNEKMAEDAAKAMIEELKRRGYLSAKLIAFKSEELNHKSDLALHVFVNEGLQTRIQRIQFRGSELIPESKLLEILGMQEGNPLNLVQLEDGIELIKHEYRNQGHLNIQFTNEATNQIVTYSEKNQFADLYFEIKEGPLYRLGDIRVFGNEKTDLDVILREVQVAKDEIVSEKKIIETEDRLRRLGIFSQVNLELLDVPEDSLKKSLKITVQEGIPGNLGFGMGYRNDLGVRLFGDVTYANLLGRNHSWVVNASSNRRLESYQFFEYSAQMSYIWPWFILGETTFRPSLNAEKRQYLDFDAETFGFSASLDRMIWKRIGLSTGLTYALEQVRQFNATKDPLDNSQLRIGSITPLVRIDLRDNPLMPRKGMYALSSFEYANPLFGSQGDPIPLSYGRFQVRTDWYLDKIPNVVWYTSLRGGWLKNFADSSPNGVNDRRIKVPLIKQFALGGVNSLRGFRDREINTTDYDLQGYATFTNYRTQFDYFVTSNLSFGPFLDAGNLNIDSFSFGSLRYGTGVGMRYMTPVGPVNFDWGTKLFPKPGEQVNAFYFSLGVI